MSDSNYFQAIKTAVFYKKNTSKMFHCNFLMFLDVQGSCDQYKNESWGKIICWKVASEMVPYKSNFFSLISPVKFYLFSDLEIQIFNVMDICEKKPIW